MAKKFRRIGVMLLALIMCASMLCTPAFAAQTINGNTWYGDELAVEIPAYPAEDAAVGNEGYTFMSLFRQPAHGYEFGGHFLGDGEGPQTFVVIDTVEHAGTTWTPNGIYDPMKSNYEVTYCCDVETMMKDATLYKRLNLEDSEYYNEAQAAKIRAIVTNAYPYVSLEKMKAELAKDNFANADKLTRNEVLAAVQAAIWASANDMTAEDFRYQKSYKVSDNLQWGYPLHDTSAESGLDVSGKRVFKTYEEVGARIDSLVDYLLEQEAVYADKAQIVITKLEMEGDPVLAGDGKAEVTLNLELNNSGSGYEDKIAVSIFANDKEIATFPVELGKEQYTIKVTAGCEDTIKAVVSGTQVLPAGVYFYAPKAADVNGDGVATGREVSQNMVGVAMGETSVYAEDEIDLSIVDIPEPPVPEAPTPTPGPGNMDFPVNKEADGLDENDQTNVTLTVPGTAEGDIDVVLVLGGGMQANKETVNSAINLFKPLMESGKSKVKLGLISLERGQEIILDLNSEEAVLNPDTYVQLIEDKFAYISTLPEGSTNLHSQLVEAKRMLDADTEVDADNKYVFVIATGRTYWFDDENGNQATIVNKVNNTYYWGHYLWQSQRGGHTSLYMIPDRYNNNYDAFFADVCKWVAADGDTYVYTPGFNNNDTSAYANWYANNNKDLKALGIASSRFGNGIVNPVPTAANFVTGVPAAIGSGNNPQNALNYERAQYESAMAYKAMVDAGYNCYAICSESPNYQNGSEYIKQGAKYTGTSTIQVGHSFMNYLARLGGQTEAPAVWDYTRDAQGNMISTATVLQENFFKPIEEDILYGCSTNSTVEDFIGKNENGNFEFVQEAEAMTLTVGGVAYTTAKVDAKEGATSSYTFTAPEATEPTFWLDYYYGDGETTERFVWTFGESVYLGRDAKLTYKLQLTDKQEAEGEYIVNTNNSATLYPVDSNGNEGDPKDFPVPEVDYVVEKVEEEKPPVTITFKKGQASNISFMLIDKATGEVTFLEKIDIGDETSFEIPTAEGKISAVFVKQSTSGMFWFAEEVDEEVQQSVIDCLKDNNPSYKGHNAIAFGEGKHDLEFKKGKIATYTFSGVTASIENEVVPAAAAPEEKAPAAAPKEEAPAMKATAPAAETPAEPASTFHEGEKTHLLGDAEGDLATFNFKVDEAYKPAAGEERYAVVGAGEQTEFWTAYMSTKPVKEGEVPVQIGETSLYTGGDGRQINGIYLNGQFYPAEEVLPGEKLLAAYNGLQQAMLMNGEGKKVAVYCADHVTSTTTEALYDVVNIEDATHYDEATAAKIRAVAVNGYWGGIESVDQYGSLAKLKAKMAASGKFTQEEIDHLSPGVALSATQFAIWELANEDDDRQVVNVQYIQKNRVAGYNGKSWNTLKLTPESEDPCVDLIFKLSHYLTELPGISAAEMSTGDTVLNYKNILKDVSIEVLHKAEGHANNADSNKDNDAYVTNVVFDMLQVSEKDSLIAKIVDAEGNVYATGRIAGAQQDGEIALTDNGNGTYTFPGVTLIENAETTYTVVVEGVQYLERNVYLYFAGERGASQTLIGYDEGEFEVDVESSVKKTFNVDEPETPPTVTFKSGDASNISFMLIDKATGAVEFVKKVDIGGETSFEIPTAEGKISAVFIKQSTSGMFWFAEEVDEATQQAVIDCLKANNPSYKDQNAIAFGGGAHKLEFKKNKFVTYQFDGVAAVSVSEATKAVETKPAETEPVVAEPVLAVNVKGANVASWTVNGDITAIYIAAKDKVPAVIWTSAEVDEATLTAIAAELGADAEAKVVSGLGTHEIEYQHNKNKTKTVTYTFE